MASSAGLKFTQENPVEGTLQFLDVRLSLQPSHVCWQYAPRSKKRLLPYESHHSKVVKRGIALSCLRAALTKSCPHKMMDSFSSQAHRLEQGGYPSALFVGVVETLLKRLRMSTAGPERVRPSVRPVVLPYVHKVSHGIKKVASKHHVPVLFSAPRKLEKLCGRIDRGGRRGVGCAKKHKKQFVNCEVGVVYKIPLSCGKVYIGQSGRCINDRLREHDLAVRSSPSGHLAVHCDRCGCVPLFNDTAIVTRHTNQRTREISEAFSMSRCDEGMCVSSPSIALFGSEIAYMCRFEASL